MDRAIERDSNDVIKAGETTRLESWLGLDLYSVTKKVHNDQGRRTTRKTATLTRLDTKNPIPIICPLMRLVTEYQMYFLYYYQCTPLTIKVFYFFILWLPPSPVTTYQTYILGIRQKHITYLLICKRRRIIYYPKPCSCCFSSLQINTKHVGVSK